LKHEYQAQCDEKSQTENFKLILRCFISFPTDISNYWLLNPWFHTQAASRNSIIYIIW